MTEKEGILPVSNNKFENTPVNIRYTQKPLTCTHQI